MWFFNILPICVCAVGGYLTVRLRGFFLLRPLAVLREIKESLKREGAVSSLCLALAGTLGVGNIIGVGVGLIVGGAGSIFWLVISSLFATALKYSEACISTDISGGLGDGMIVSLRHSFKRLGKPLSILYAAVCLVFSLTMGGALQSVGASGAISSAFDLDEGKILLHPWPKEVNQVERGDQKLIWCTAREQHPVKTLRRRWHKRQTDSQTKENNTSLVRSFFWTLFKV